MRHVPVLLTEVLDLLQPKSGQNFIDCTLGDAGHAEAILEKTSPNGKLLGIDADPESLLRAKQNLYRFEGRAVFARDNFVNLTKIIAEHNFGPVNGILLDLGWSSPQFEERGRGFSFEGDEPLDMRYDPNCHSERGLAADEESRNKTTTRSLDYARDDNYVGQRSFTTFRMTSGTAADVVNNYSESELIRIFKLYGEEKLSSEIAGAIVEERKDNPIERTKQLVKIILDVYRTKLHSEKDIPWIGGLHPATKVFQALRIEVNHELEVLKQALPQAVEALAPQGRLAVISFHSLEDRIVKQYFQKIAGSHIKVITKKPVVATDAEARENPRARSAKLRVVEKLIS